MHSCRHYGWRAKPDLARRAVTIGVGFSILPTWGHVTTFRCSNENVSRVYKYRKNQNGLLSATWSGAEPRCVKTVGSHKLWSPWTYRTTGRGISMFCELSNVKRHTSNTGIEWPSSQDSRNRKCFANAACNVYRGRISTSESHKPCSSLHVWTYIWLSVLSMLPDGLILGQDNDT